MKCCRKIKRCKNRKFSALRRQDIIPCGCKKMCTSLGNPAEIKKNMELLKLYQRVYGTNITQ